MKNVSRTITVTKVLYRAYNPNTKAIDLIWTCLYDTKPEHVEKELKKNASIFGCQYLDTETVLEPVSVTPSITLRQFLDEFARHEDVDSATWDALFGNPFAELESKDGRRVL